MSIGRAKVALEGHSLALCKDEIVLTRDGRGIFPLLDVIDERGDLNGFSAADVVVGKAAAMLFVVAGVSVVFAKTLSVSGKEILERFGIAVEYDVLVERILDRAGRDLCPMEKSVLAIEDPTEAVAAIRAAALSIRG